MKFFVTITYDIYTGQKFSTSYIVDADLLKHWMKCYSYKYLTVVKQWIATAQVGDVFHAGQITVVAI